jgi:hypothetical protein
LCCMYQSFLLLDGQIVSICTLAADPADFIRGCCSRGRLAVFAVSAKTGASVCC